jgi:uncharacterized protein
MPIAHGRFTWYDLMTPDPAAAQQFYTQVVGWGTQKWDNPAMPYTMWTSGDAPLGGIMPMGEAEKAQGVPPHWLPYVGVEDVDAAAAEAKELGGKVLYQPTDIPEVGRFAVIQDPQGAVIAIFTPREGAPAPEGTPRPGQFSWHELTTTDYPAALDFYGRIFGWHKTSEFDMGGMGLYQMYGQGEQTYGGMFNKTPDMPVPPNWLCYIQVEDVDQAVARVTQLGGTVINGPMEVPGGDRIAQCFDPQGAAFALHAKKH